MDKNVRCKKIDWREGGLQFSVIGTKNVSEPDITPRGNMQHDALPICQIKSVNDFCGSG